MNSIGSRLFAALLIILGRNAFAQPPVAADSLTLRNAVELVLARNPAIQEAVHMVDGARARVVQSRSGYFPSVDVDATYTYLTPVSELSFFGTNFEVFPANNYDGHIGVRQLLFDFSKTGRAVDLADSRVSLADDGLATIRRDLSFRSAESFYRILFLHRSIAVQSEEIRTLNEHLLTARKRIASGTATQLDALTTEVRVAAARTQEINLESSLSRDEIAFRGLASLPPEAPLNFKGEFAPEVQSLNQDSLIAVARAGRIEAVAASHAVSTAEIQQKVAGSNDNPSLNAIFAYGVKNGYIPNLDAWRGNIVAGVELKVPIFDGSKTSGMEAEAAANLQAAESRRQTVDLGIQSDVQQAVSDVQASIEKLQVSEINVEQASLALETARLRYEAGTVANLDLLDAETAFAQAKLTNLEALYEYVINSLHLRRATGSPVIGP